jgi:hypothetical protein
MADCEEARDALGETEFTELAISQNVQLLGETDRLDQLAALFSLLLWPLTWQSVKHPVL